VLAGVAAMVPGRCPGEPRSDSRDPLLVPHRRLVEARRAASYRGGRAPGGGPPRCGGARLPRPPREAPRPPLPVLCSPPVSPLGRSPVRALRHLGGALPHQLVRDRGGRAPPRTLLRPASRAVDTVAPALPAGDGALSPLPRRDGGGAGPQRDLPPRD